MMLECGGSFWPCMSFGAQRVRSIVRACAACSSGAPVFSCALKPSWPTFANAPPLPVADHYEPGAGGGFVCCDSAPPIKKDIIDVCHSSILV